MFFWLFVVCFSNCRSFCLASVIRFQVVVNWRTDIMPGMVVRYRDNWFEVVRVDSLEDYMADIKLYVNDSLFG